MLNSTFIFLNSYNKNKTWSALAFFSWIAYMLINQTSMGWAFSVFNIIVFMAVVIPIRFVNNKKINMVLSVLSILFWSILIDSVTYLMYPEFSSGLTILQYMINGLLFNYKYIFLNLLILVSVELITVISVKLKNIIVKNELVKNIEKN